MPDSKDSTSTQAPARASVQEPFKQRRRKFIDECGRRLKGETYRFGCMCAYDHIDDKTKNLPNPKVITGLATICSLSNFNMKTAQRALDEMEAAGLAKAERSKGKVTTFTLLFDQVEQQEDQEVDQGQNDLTPGQNVLSRDGNPGHDPGHDQGHDLSDLRTESESSERTPETPETPDKKKDSCAVADATRTSAPASHGKEGKGSVDRFDEFWNAYPRRGNAGDHRKPAQKIFDRLVRQGISPDDLIAAAKQYAAKGQAGTEYVKMAKTWLQDECWKPDERTEPVQHRTERPRNGERVTERHVHPLVPDHAQHMGKIYLEKDWEEWRSWLRYYEKRGEKMPVPESRYDLFHQQGWTFDSVRPPGWSAEAEAAEHQAGCERIRAMMAADEAKRKRQQEERRQQERERDEQQCKAAKAESFTAVQRDLLARASRNKEQAA